MASNGECIHAFAVLVLASGLANDGAIAKRLCRGLQSRLDQFDSGSRLHIHSPHVPFILFY